MVYINLAEDRGDFNECLGKTNKIALLPNFGIRLRNSRDLRNDS